jgi:hypothetical protein
MRAGSAVQKRRGQNLVAVWHRAVTLAFVLTLAAAPAHSSEEKSKPSGKEAQLSGTSEANQTKEAGEDKSGVALAGQVSEESAAPWRQIRFWLTIENHTRATLDTIQLKNPEIPGFQLTRLCWPSKPNGDCKDLRSAPQDRYDLADHLREQQSLTVWGVLKPTKSDHKQRAFASIGWLDAGVPSSKTVTLGEVESLNFLRALALEVIHGWEWSFPLVTFLAGGAYELFRRHREKTAQKKEDAKKAKEREAEELRDHQKRTWNLMLPMAQRAALKFYTPMAGAVHSARVQLSRYRLLGNDQALRRGCYHMVFFHWWLRRAINEVGGYYFKSRSAEILADLLYGKHTLLLGLKEESNMRLLARAVDIIKLNTTVDGFIGQLDHTGSDVEKFWVYFSDWALSDNCREDLAVLDAYGAMLEYESNRPSVHWYGTLDPIRFATPEKTRRAICDWQGWKEPARLNLSDDLATMYEAMASDYLREVEKPLVSAL